MFNHRRCTDVGARIAVATYTYLGGSEADLHNRDVMFVINPLEMWASISGKLGIRNADTSRLFGFLPRGASLKAQERDQCTALFGPSELVIPRHGQIERPINVLLLPIKGGPKLADTEDTVDLLRQGVWLHPVRNRRIARLAAALAAGNLSSLGWLANKPDVMHELGRCGPKPGVGIFCNNIEHAIELAGLLPGWRLVTGVPVRTNGLSSQGVEVLKLARRQPSRPGKGVIVTEAGLSRIRRCNVIIRADAGVGAIPTHWASTSAGACPPRPALVVDFYDLYHSDLTRRSKWRRTQYLAAGWRMPVEFPELLDQFLATLKLRADVRCSST